MEFATDVACVALHRRRGEDQVALVVDSEKSTLPQQRIWKLNVDIADVHDVRNRFRNRSQVVIVFSLPGDPIRRDFILRAGRKCARNVSSGTCRQV